MVNLSHRPKVESYNCADKAKPMDDVNMNMFNDLVKLYLVIYQEPMPTYLKK